MLNPEAVKRTGEGIAEETLYLGGFSAWYSRVYRATIHDDGRKESDVEHSFMLGLVSVNLAERLYPQLDRGLISQFAYVHDMTKAITGDTPTFGISDEDRARKEHEELEAQKILVNELPDPWSGLLERYTEQEEPEARFVRLVDKLMPALMHIHGGGRRTFEENYGVKNETDFWKMRGDRSEELRELYPEFPKIHDLSDELLQYATNVMWSEDVISEQEEFYE